MRSRTLLQLRDSVRRLSDTVGDNHVLDADLTAWINESLGDYYDQIVDAQGPEYFMMEYVDTATKPTDGLTKAHRLALSLGTNRVGIHTVLGVEKGDALVDNPDQSGLALGGLDYPPVRGRYGISNPIPLRPFNLFDREAGYSFDRPKYRIFGAWGNETADGVFSDYTHEWYIAFEPWDEDIVFRLFFVPQPPVLSADADSFEFISGWEEFVIVDAAIKVLVKQERDTSAFMMRLSRIQDRIARLAARMNSEPETVTDVHRYDYGGVPELYDFWRGR